MIRSASPLLVCSLLCVAAGSEAPRPERRLDAPDGRLRAVIRTDRDSAESIIEIWSGGKRRFRWSGSSRDGGHGWSVEKSAWTHDGKFFVFSATSSGGHQPWHFPTFVYRASTNTVLNLDRLNLYRFASSITTPNFRLLNHDVVKTQMLGTGQKWIPIHLQRLKAAGQRSE